MINFSDFQKIEMRVGEIVDVQEFPKARKPAYQLKVNLGAEIGIKRTSAQATNYPMQSLLGKKIICVANFPAKQIADFMSEVLVLGVEGTDGKLSLLVPDLEAPLGSRVY